MPDIGKITAPMTFPFYQAAVTVAKDDKEKVSKVHYISAYKIFKLGRRILIMMH